MDLFCPHCTRRVTVPDEKSGQVLNCPLCTKQFMAPSLAPAPVAPKPEPPPVKRLTGMQLQAPVESYGVGPAPVTPPGPAAAPPPPSPPPISSGPAPAAPPPAPPTPPGSYTRSCSCQLTGDWLAFVPPVCVLLIFMPLSFFPWHHVDLTLWGLSFVEPHASFIFYTILLFPALLLSFLALPFDKGWLPPPAPIAPFLPLKNLLVGVILALGFFMLGIDCLTAHFVSAWNPQMVALKIAFWLHFVATVASFLLFWVNWRKKSNLPPPTCDMRW